MAVVEDRHRPAADAARGTRRREYPGLDVALAFARRQDGLVTYEQARGAGLTDGQLRQLVRDGSFFRPFRGTYLVTGSDHLWGRVRAALHGRSGAVVCGLTAARLLDLRALPLPIEAEPVHLLVPDTARRVSPRGVVLHTGDPRGGQLVSLGGMPVTSVPRTLADLVLGWERSEAVALLDAALHDHQIPNLDAVRAALFGRAGVAGRYPWLALVDGRAESALESWIRLILLDGNIRPEEVQYRVRDPAGRILARVDLAWPSRKIYLEADGVAFHGSPADPRPLHDDRDRQNRLRRAGWHPVRFTWKDVLARPSYIVRTVGDALADR